jgi:hypothetical protein
VAAGAAMGAIGGLATRLRLGADGRPLGRAGVLAASMWIGGVGARLAFGRATSEPGVWYFPTGKIGIYYADDGTTLTVQAVVDARRLRELP